MKYYPCKYSPDKQLVEISEEEYKRDRPKYIKLSDETVVRVLDASGKSIMSMGYFKIPESESDCNWSKEDIAEMSDKPDLL